MYTEDEVKRAVLQVLSDPVRIPYTEDGINYLLKEVKKLLPDPKAIITCQSIEDMSASDRLERKIPEFTVTYQ